MAGATKRPRRATKPQRGATAARGEHAIELGGRSYVLRPSHEACVTIETECEQSLMQLMQKANCFALNYFEIGLIVSELIRAGAAEDDQMTRAISADRISQLVFEEGVAGIYPLLVTVLASAITGGRKVSGEAKAVTELPTTEKTDTA